LELQGQLANQCFGHDEKCRRGIPGGRHRRPSGDHVTRETGDRREPLVGEKHDLHAALMRLFGKTYQAVLIAAYVEANQAVTFAHVDETVTPVALLAGEMKDVRPDDGEVGGEIPGNRVGEAAADKEGLRLAVDKQFSEARDLFLGQMPERLVDVL